MGSTMSTCEDGDNSGDAGAPVIIVVKEHLSEKVQYQLGLTR